MMEDTKMPKLDNFTKMKRRPGEDDIVNNYNIDEDREHQDQGKF